MELILPEIGFISLALALVIACFNALTGFIGIFLHVPRPMSRSVFWFFLQFVFLAGAFICLTISFIHSDFSVIYVAQHSHRLAPLSLKIAAIWGGHEGSLLLWVVFISAWSCLFAWRYRSNNQKLFPLTLSVLSVISAILLLFVVLYSDPFARIFPPAIEGRDLNPMLQHWGLILHPPLLYFGYSGLMVTTAIIIAALIQRQFNQSIAWVCWRFAAPSWCVLTVGIVLGSWWAYSELGWGGWWFWDPVENASLLPWLCATALLHSLSISRRTGLYQHWTMLLAIATFILSLLGTLIVRSGILMSVHAFALDNVKAVPLFLAFSVLSLSALLTYGWRAKFSTKRSTISSPNERYILLTLILFSTVVIIVLTGTLFPLLYGLFDLGKISVGAPYFNQALLPFGILMLFIITLSALTFWKKYPLSLKWRGWLITITTFASISALWSQSLLIALSCSLFIAILLIMWLRPIHGICAHLPSLIAHTGVIIFAAGIALSMGSRQEISANIALGQSIHLAGYQFSFEKLQLAAQPNYTTEKALIRIDKDQQAPRYLTTESRFYLARQQQMIEPGIDWGFVRNWYVVLGEKTAPNRYAMRFYVQDGISWIWGGALFMCLGVVIGWLRGKNNHV